MVYERTLPYFKEQILPKLKEGKNVLVVSHGNTIRALMKYIESIADEKMADIEMLFGVVLIYDLNEEGKMIKKEARNVESKVNA
jgi:2,3-bisphosphoglycerate-dependent phosphoglycerate mutase